MIHPLLVAALLCGDAEPAPAAPKGVAPIVTTGKIDSNGNLVREIAQQVFVPVTREMEVNRNGKVEKVTMTAYESVFRKVEVQVKLDKATVTTAGGKKLDVKDLAKRLATSTPLVMSADGKPVDAGYLRLFRPDTVVIVVPIVMGLDLKSRPLPPPPGGGGLPQKKKE